MRFFIYFYLETIKKAGHEMSLSDFDLQNFYDFVKIATKDTIQIDLQSKASKEYIEAETLAIAYEFINEMNYEPITSDAFHSYAELKEK